eukprot:CAMPEP_0181468542 /NCGR_PEP_ID=MMETSP1110-20121109/37543_1 /TAXON_ID=174948 /ORGANISM="Symbiodinium sp., Strain CCMP421" /LENGTH=381 /DNA_ID=CAMNT_0023593393 /DNA_START=38 /DNA_END=1183 /DNA_ORIENTATION=-
MTGTEASLARQFPPNLLAVYNVEEYVGQGAFSTVWRAMHKTSGQIRAIKKIDTTDLSPREVAHEIAIMRFLRHENVVRCYDVFLEGQYVHVVMDMFNGGDLVDGLNVHRRAHGRLPSRQLRNLASQMSQAIAHVHALQIIHRDVKGENFLSDRPNIGDPAVKVALSDFGTAIRVEKSEKVYSRVGTPAFWAPEIFNGPYDYKVDVWAVGVTTYILLTGALPFEGQEQICRPVGDEAPVYFPPHCARDCASFLTATLAKDVKARPSSKAALQSDWFSKSPEPTPEIARRPYRREVVESGCHCWVGLTASICSAIKFCLDHLCDQKEVEAAAARWSKMSSKQSSAGKTSTLGGMVEKDMLEKQATDLTKQISVSLMQHQGSVQ